MTITPHEFALPEHLVGAAVRAERKHRFWSQEQLAHRLAVVTATWPEPITLHPTAITRLEKGARSISLNEAYALCVVLDLDLGEILGMTGSPEFLRAVRDRRVVASRLLEIVESVLGPAVEGRDIPSPDVERIMSS